MRDFISLADLSPRQWTQLLHLSREVKSRPSNFRRMIPGKSIVLVFEKPSLRTRLTFELGIQQLGGDAVYLDYQEANLGQREALGDVARKPGTMVRLPGGPHLLPPGADPALGVRAVLGDQRPHRRGAPLSGPGRHLHPDGEMDERGRTDPGLHRRREQRLRVPGSCGRPLGHVLYGGDSPEPPALRGLARGFSAPVHQRAAPPANGATPPTVSGEPMPSTLTPGSAWGRKGRLRSGWPNSVPTR